MNNNTSFEFKKLSQEEIKAGVERAHQMRSQFALESFNNLVVFLKTALKSKSNVQGGSNLAHPA